MATAMKGVTKALTQMNKKINLPGLQKIMAEFMKENEKADITAEMIGDTLDDAMEEEGSAEEEELIVGQVLDELGVNMSQDMSSVPVGSVGGVKQEAKADEAQGKRNLFRVLLCITMRHYRLTTRIFPFRPQSRRYQIWRRGWRS
jgi:charged multivesicular body protein 2A